MSTLILGSRTRLARSLLQEMTLRAESAFLVAWSENEMGILKSAHPANPIYPAWQNSSLPAASTQLVIFVCALGPVHPGLPDPRADTLRATRDLEILKRILDENRNGLVHIVFVSSVVALFPRRARAYYAGWKSMVEGVLESLSASHPHCLLSVLYPGRLIEQHDNRRPVSFLYTTFRDLAQEMMKIKGTQKPLHRIVGIDARLWLATQAMLAWRPFVFGRPI